jgi:hypothetical protein
MTQDISRIPMSQEEFDELSKKIKSDTRTKDEIFESMVNRLIRDSGAPREQAIEGARNLFGFFEVMMNAAERKNSEAKQEKSEK